MSGGQMLEMADAITVVFDRSSGAAEVDSIRSIGGGWRLGVDLWRRQRMPYLVLCAATRQRMKRRAPLILMAEDVRVAAAAACGHLDDVKCVWLYACSDATRDQVMPVVLADTVTEGRA